MRRALAPERQETDEDGRVVFRLGGACPICGGGPDMKYSGDGRVVLYHKPASCTFHTKQEVAKAAERIAKQRELDERRYGA